MSFSVDYRSGDGFRSDRVVVVRRQRPTSWSQFWWPWHGWGDFAGEVRAPGLRGLIHNPVVLLLFLLWCCPLCHSHRPKVQAKPWALEGLEFAKVDWWWVSPPHVSHPSRCFSIITVSRATVELPRSCLRSMLLSCSCKVWGFMVVGVQCWLFGEGKVVFWCVGSGGLEVGGWVG